MSLLHFCQWLATTPWSVALHESLYAYLIILTVHVVTLFLLIGTAVILDLRLLGMTMPDVRVSEIAAGVLPWMTGGFLMMVTSGSLLFYANPTRYQNLFFRTKMVMLVLAGVNAWVFHNTVYRSVSEWDLDPVPPRRARVAACVSLVLWAVIIMAGRLIAYNGYWFDCGSQPQPAIINLLEGCVTDSR
jgi:hypothetical protein